MDTAMIEQSDLCIVAADHSKFGHSAFAKISDVSVADAIVTDAPLGGSLAEELTALGVKILP